MIWHDIQPRLGEYLFSVAPLLLEPNQSQSLQVKHSDPNITISCVALAKPQISITWLRDNQVISSDSPKYQIQESPETGTYDFGLTEALRSSLSIQQMEGEIGCGNRDVFDGHYQCRATQNGDDGTAVWSPFINITTLCKFLIQFERGY